MNEQQERALSEGLAALAATTRGAGASPRIEQAILDELRRSAPRRQDGLRWLPLAAALLLTATAGTWLAHRAHPPAVESVEPAGFVALPGAAALPPFESGSIVRVALPVTTLPSYGLAIVPDLGLDPVIAELLVAQDGQPRAIRLVNDSD